MRASRVFLSLLLVFLATEAWSATKVRYVPGIAIIPEVRTPDGNLRVYETPRGPIYWSPGYPIYQGDTIKLNVFVSTGGDTLEIVKVRLDNTEIASLTRAPWSIELSASKLGVGYHAVEAWAKCTGSDGKSNSATRVFFIAPKDKNLSPEAIKDPKQAALAIAGISHEDPAPGVTSNDPEADKALKDGSPIVLRHPVQLNISLPEGMTKFSYSLIRDGNEEYRSPELSADTRIKLQPARGEIKGLLPGELFLVVWGINEKGAMGQPAAIQINIPKPTDGDEPR